MPPSKILTKKQKKEISRRKASIILVCIGLALIALSLVYVTFFEDKKEILSPLSKDQTSVNLKIEKKLKEKKISFLSIETRDDLNYQIKLDLKSEVIIDPKKNIDEQLSSLQLIISALKIEGKAFKRLDFRYQKPIITF